MTMFQAPSPPYGGPPAHSSGTANKPITRIVMHCTVSPCELGGARSVAAYFRTPAATGSAQYTADPGEVIQAAYDSVVCWGAPPNPHSLHVELCDPMKGRGRRWSNPDHISMLRKAAELVAALCLAYDVPVRRLDPGDLLAGRHGICGHDDVSDAWHQSTHWDPGPAFPWGAFMTLVRHAVADLKREAAAVPTPAEVVKEHAKPTRVQRARRLLRRALKGADPSHPRRGDIARALAELPDR